MGLRLKEGITWTDFNQKLGKSAKAYLDTDRIEFFVNQGWMIHNDIGLMCSDEGRLRLDSLLKSLIKK
jgi:coproporphyrinogen III oxidase-like Fe-S oxidoreductase